MNGHLGEDAELYPLGLLDDDAARLVELHVAECAVCAERVAQASSVAASLSAILPAGEASPALGDRVRKAARSPRFRPVYRMNFASIAVAAVLALAVLGLGWQTFMLRGRLATQDVALATLVKSHFNHVSMRGESVIPVSAKILYARDGSWVYIIADKAGGTLHAVATEAGAPVDLGTLENTGETASLLVHPGRRIDGIVLQRDAVDVATATLAY